MRVRTQIHVVILERELFFAFEFLCFVAGGDDDPLELDLDGHGSAATVGYDERCD